MQTSTGSTTPKCSLPHHNTSTPLQTTQAQNVTINLGSELENIKRRKVHQMNATEQLKL